MLNARSLAGGHSIWSDVMVSFFLTASSVVWL